jgi:hypothetical protein
MMATGLGSFVEGAVKGYSTVKEMERREALQKRDDERFAMEQERYAMEKTRAEREMEQQRVADEAKKEALTVMEDARFGRGAFAKLADPTKVQEVQQATQSVEQKSDMSYDRAEARRLGRTVDETQTASVTPQEENIFKQGGEGLYADQRAADNLKYQLIGEAMKKSLINKGDFGAAMLVDRDIKKMEEEGYELQRKKTAALVMAGASPDQVVPALKKVYGFVDDGKSIDPKKTTFDAKTNTYNLAVVDDKTGEVSMRPMNQQSMLSALNQLTPAQVLELNINSQKRAEDLSIAEANRKEDVKLKKRELDIKDKEAGATLAFRNAQRIALGDQVKGADAKAKAETIDKSFPYADKMFKPEDLLGKTDAEKKSLEALVAADTRSRNYAVGLASLNPKIDPRIIIGAAKSASTTYPSVLKDKSGRSYFSYGGSQIYID